MKRLLRLRKEEVKRTLHETIRQRRARTWVCLNCGVRRAKAGAEEAAVEAVARRHALLPAEAVDVVVEDEVVA